MYDIRETDAGLLIAERKDHKPRSEPQDMDTTITERRVMFSGDGRKMIVLEDPCSGAMVPCYNLRASSFDAIGRFEAKWGRSGTAQDLSAALRFLASEDVELCT